MDPLLWSTYLASVAAGPITLAGMLFTSSCEGNQTRRYKPEKAINSACVTGIISLPFMRHCSEISRNLERCVMKQQPKVKLFSDGKLRAIPYSQARSEALKAAVPLWVFFGIQSLIITMGNSNDNQRLAAALGVTYYLCWTGGGVSNAKPIGQ
jgi:hypothetical protein